MDSLSPAIDNEIFMENGKKNEMEEKTVLFFIASPVVVVVVSDPLSFTSKPRSP